MPARAEDREPPPEPAPGDALLHPVVLGAIGLLVLNDHVLKQTFASWWTGKLSDLAGLLFFPLLLQAAVEVGAQAVGRWTAPSRAVLIGAAVATAVVFSAVQLSEGAADLYRYGLGALQWPFRAVMAVVTGDLAPRLRPVAVTPDPTDLLTVPAVGIAVALGWRRSSGVHRSGG